mmetsp:Transcript_31345/g.72148  ORF Transcript_31345/g.72148 Transcript_31345/m.72148 type:complete len:135 (-) Transcript_31345:243-647(-)
MTQAPASRLPECGRKVPNSRAAYVITPMMKAFVRPTNAWQMRPPSVAIKETAVSEESTRNCANSKARKRTAQGQHLKGLDEKTEETSNGIWMQRNNVGGYQTRHRPKATVGEVNDGSTEGTQLNSANRYCREEF